MFEILFHTCLKLCLKLFETCSKHAFDFFDTVSNVLNDLKQFETCLRCFETFWDISRHYWTHGWDFLETVWNRLVYLWNYLRRIWAVFERHLERVCEAVWGICVFHILSIQSMFWIFFAYWMSKHCFELFFTYWMSTTASSIFGTWPHWPIHGLCFSVSTFRCPMDTL